MPVRYKINYKTLFTLKRAKITKKPFLYKPVLVVFLLPRSFLFHFTVVQVMYQLVQNRQSLTLSLCHLKRGL